MFRVTRLLALGFVAAQAILLAPPGMGQDVVPFADTSRLISIGGSLTEIIYALGEEERLVARDQTALYPEAALELPDVGYMRALSPEGVLSVNPSAILIIEGSGPQETLDVLSKASVPYVTVPESYSHEGILTKVRVVGAALGVEEKAEALAQKLDAELAAAEAITRDVPARKKVLFVLSIQGGKINASGTDTAANGIIALAGADNAVTEYQGYKTLTDEAIISADPDLILMMDNGGDHSATNDALLAHPAVQLTKAGRNGALARIDGALLLGFGPRTPAAILELARLIYGDAVTSH